MDLLDVIVTIMECIAIGFGMEVGAVVAKVFAVRVLNTSSPVDVYDAEDDAEDDETQKKRRRRRASRAASGPSTTASFRAIM